MNFLKMIANIIYFHEQLLAVCVAGRCVFVGSANRGYEPCSTKQSAASRVWSGLSEIPALSSFKGRTSFYTRYS